MFSDLYETNDKRWWDVSESAWMSQEKKYVYDYYVEKLAAGTINSGANRWEVNSLQLDAEVKHWLINQAEQNRFSGLTSTLNSRNEKDKFEHTPSYHGYESASNDINSKITKSYEEINGRNMKINRF